MKRFITLLSLILMVASIEAQTPTGINYQSIIRDTDGNALPYEALSVTMNIRSATPNGVIVYSEIHETVSNGFGLVNLIIGQGLPQSGSFGSINWAGTSHFLEVAVDFDGNGQWESIGTSQFNNVPYAIHAKTVESYSETDPVFSAWDKSSGIAIIESQITDLQNYLTNIFGESIGDLSDVDLTGLAAGKVLKFNAVTNKWMVADDEGITAETDPVFSAWDKKLGSLSDVDLTGIISGKFLVYDGVDEKWVASNDIALMEEYDPTWAGDADQSGTIHRSGSVGIGAAPIANNLFYVYRPNTAYGESYSNIFGYRSGSSTPGNGGTSWGVSGIDAAIKGQSHWGNNYSAGIAGYSDLDFANSAAVIGVNNWGNQWAALAMKDANSAIWAGYFNGNVNISGEIKITGGNPGHGKVLTGDAEGNASWQEGSLTLPYSHTTEHQGTLFGLTNSATSGTTYTVSGVNASVEGTGVFGRATATTGTTNGVFGMTHSTDGRGVFGEAYSPSGNTYGVFGVSASVSGSGVFGWATSTDGSNRGVQGRTSSINGSGVFGEATSEIGYNEGGRFESYSISGVGVYGYTHATSGLTTGVSGVSLSPDGSGVLGHATATTGINYGVRGVSESSSGVGVFGNSTSETGYNYGVEGRTASANCTGVYGFATASTGTPVAVSGNVISSDGYSGYFNGGRFHVDGNVGIKTINPTTELDVNGTVRIRGGNPGAGKVLTSDANGNANWQPGVTTYQVGDFAHGGVVFYVQPCGTKGLVCAIEDQNGGSGIKWRGGAVNYYTRATGDKIYSGKMNTSIIISVHSAKDDFDNHAALECANYQGGGFGDWYLPSREEIYLMWQHRIAINATATANGGSGFASDYYWSSTEAGGHHAWVEPFSYGYQHGSNKENTWRVRAVRAF
jgi:hypothetical protein